MTLRIGHGNVVVSGVIIWSKELSLNNETRDTNSNEITHQSESFVHEKRISDLLVPDN
jgi:hypothetical protein